MSRTKRTDPIPTGRVSRMKLLRAILLGASLWFITSGYAQHSLHLLALDSATAEPLFGASAVLLSTSLSGGADMDGRITLQNIPDGSYTLRVVSVGYMPLEMTVTLPASDGTLTVRLSSFTDELLRSLGM